MFRKPGICGPQCLYPGKPVATDWTFTTIQAPCWRDRARDGAYIVGHFSGANDEKNNNGFTGKQACPRGKIVRMWILVRKELLRNLFSLQLVVSS